MARETYRTETEVRQAACAALRCEHRRAKPKYWWRPDVCVNQDCDDGPWRLQLAFPMKDHDSYTPLNARICPHCGKELPAEVRNG